MRDTEQFAGLKGKTLTAIRINDDQDEIAFDTADGETFKLYHGQDCCETVTLNEVIGSLDDLIGAPLLEAEEVESEQNAEPDPNTLGGYAESWTWTFYKLGTIKGSVTLRWLGESNGYYSESVSFARAA